MVHYKFTGFCDKKMKITIINQTFCFSTVRALYFACNQTVSQPDWLRIHKLKVKVVTMK